MKGVVVVDYKEVRIMSRMSVGRGVERIGKESQDYLCLMLSHCIHFHRFMGDPYVADPEAYGPKISFKAKTLAPARNEDGTPKLSLKRLARWSLSTVEVHKVCMAVCQAIKLPYPEKPLISSQKYTSSCMPP